MMNLSIVATKEKKRENKATKNDSNYRSSDEEVDEKNSEDLLDYDADNEEYEVSEDDEISEDEVVSEDDV